MIFSDVTKPELQHQNMETKHLLDKEFILKKNMGQLDRIIRIAIAVLVAILYFTNVISGTWAIILGILALVFVLTSLVGTCPLYMPFGISTRKDA